MFVVVRADDLPHLLRRALGFAAFVAIAEKDWGFAPLCGAAATPVAALKSSVANEGFAPLGGAAATPVAALKTPVAPVASEGG